MAGVERTSLGSCVTPFLFMQSVQFQLQTFSGPLDLLLNLLAEKKLSISEVSLSEVTDQFLRYLDTLEKNRADELADFLLIGSKLVLMKARSLLPQFAPEEAEEESLQEQLRLYKAFLEASKKINKLWLSPNRSLFRLEPARRQVGFLSPLNVTADLIHESMVQLVERLKPGKPIPETTIDKAISIKERIDRIRQFLSRRKQFNFHELIENTGNKTEMIVSFLALLEMMKKSVLAMSQQEVFGDIAIQKI